MRQGEFRVFRQVSHEHTNLHTVARNRQSTTVNLFSRMYDATKGAVLIDDLPITEYVAKQVQAAQEIHYQDFYTYPVTVRHILLAECCELIRSNSSVVRSLKTLAMVTSAMWTICHASGSQLKQEAPSISLRNFLNNSILPSTYTAQYACQV